MTQNERKLILKLVRFQDAVEAIEMQAAEAYDYDSLVDGGEFSGPAISRQAAREADAAAQRFGFRTADAAHMAAQAMRAQTKPAGLSVDDLTDYFGGVR